MARPSSTPRLRELVAQEVGETVVRAVADHASSLLLSIDPTCTWSIPDKANQLRWTVQLLVGYAQHGLSATDWPDHGCASGAILDVCTALYSSASNPSFGAGVLDDLESEVTVNEPVGIVLLAAYARMMCAQRGGRVPVRALAALAGVDPHHVRLLGRQGELEVDDGGVSTKNARRWLSARGLEGL